MPLHQLCEFFGRTLERQPVSAGLQLQNNEHFARDLEDKIVAPLNIFRGMRKRKTKLPDPIDRHAYQRTMLEAA